MTSAAEPGQDLGAEPGNSHRPSSEGTFRVDAPARTLFTRWIEAKLIEPGAGLFHVRTGQSGHWINLHHQVLSQARLTGEASDGIRVVFEPHKGPLPRPAVPGYPQTPPASDAAAYGPGRVSLRPPCLLRGMRHPFDETCARTIHAPHLRVITRLAHVGSAGSSTSDHGCRSRRLAICSAWSAKARHRLISVG